VAAQSESGKDKEYYSTIVELLRMFEQSLKNDISFEKICIPSTDDKRLMQVFASGSRVGYREKGVLFSDVKIIAPSIFPDGKLWYQVSWTPRHAASPPGKKWVNPQYIEPTAVEGEWEYALWDPTTQEYVEGANGKDEKPKNEAD
jgi:hypothetical protein